MSELEIKNLTKSFNGKPVLDNLSLSVEKGDILGVLGSSGAGKSTLIRCINGLEDFESGEIYFQGKFINSPDVRIARSDRMRMAMIFQQFNLLEQQNVYQNVMLALKIRKYPRELRKQKALDCIEKVGLSDKLKSYPSELSGGQKQRVAIARALALDPELILSDESTSALDPETAREILDLLAKLNKENGITILLISHQIEAVEAICNKVAIIDQGVIAETGETYDVILSPKTEVGRRILFPNRGSHEFKSGSFIEIRFNGNIDSPVIAEIVSNLNILISIVRADTRVVDGKAYGATTITRPKDDKEAERIFRFLDSKGVSYREVNS